MPEFTNPFIGVVPERKLTHAELARAIRLNISAEHEAVHLYEAHADATDNEFAKRVLHDIANEERKHIGEFMRLLQHLQPDEQQFLADGAAEVEEMMSGGGAAKPAEALSNVIPTVGNLKK
jgi:rubrerythrin